MGSPNEFENLFSKQAAEYARYRPRYPKALFEFLASITPGRRRAWDCATGNGQAALDLAEYFQEVMATDASEAQIRNAVSHPKVKYSVASADQSVLEPQSVDLVTVAQAAHWLDHGLFNQEVKRVLKPGGIIALWCYGHNRQVDAALEPVYREYAALVEPYWAPQVQFIWDEYKTILFPYEEIPAPDLSMEADWNLDAFTGYLWSWSATQKYFERNGINPLDSIADELKTAWGPPESKHKIIWRMYFRIGRCSGSH